MEITSMTNAKVKTWAKLKEKKYRDREQCFIIEGEHLVEEAYAAKRLHCLILEKGYACKQRMDVETYIVSADIMRKLTTVVSSERIIGIAQMSQNVCAIGKRLIVLDNVQDPGNAGTILRSAYAFGYDGVVFSNDSVDVYNEKVIRSSQGALFHLPIYRKELSSFLKEIKTQGHPIYVTSLKNAMPLRSIEPAEQFALVFGNEGQGVSEEILALADTTLIIEMKEFESLNVAVAASICMYAFMEKDET